MKKFRLLALALLLPTTAHAEKRSYTIDDALNLESLGSYFGGAVSFAPDGKALAFTRVRSRATLANFKWYLWDNEGGDVWVQAEASAAPVNITQGASDGSGWWAPRWSPDGKLLAMLSTRGGNMHLWLWDAQDKSLRRVSARAVEQNAAAPYAHPFLWIADRQIVYPALPEGEQPLGMAIELNTSRIATREWPKAATGKEITASVLDSGVAPDLSKRAQNQLRLIDVASNAETVVADTSTAAWAVSPSGKAVAFARQTGIYTPKAGEALPLFTRATYSFGLAALDGKPLEVSGDVSRDLHPESLRWSADGATLAFLGWQTDRTEPPRLYRLNLAEHRITAQPLGDLDASPVARNPPGLEWAGDRLLVFAAGKSGDVKPDVYTRRDWYLLGDKSPVNLTANLQAVPEELWPEQNRDSLVALADGEIWRFDPAAARLQNLTAELKPQVTRIAWPAQDWDGVQESPARGRRYTQLVIATGTDESHNRIDLASGRVTSLPAGPDAAVFRGFSDDGSTVWQRNDQRGLHLWRQPAAGKPRELVAANAFLRDIRPGRVESFDYTGLDGKPLKAYLVLPPDYVKGQRYPLLTSVYASYVAGPQPPWGADIGDGGYLNLQIPAARGYVVLKPSMPLAPEGAVSDPMLALQNGVLPAVDKAVAMGIADPQRVFVMGQSYGGFSTYGLITQTKRFTAAVALAGPTDLVAMHGAMDARMRYTEHPHESLLQQGTESGVMLMGGPPWTDLGRYLRNSPLHSVDRVQTPLLIIHGDMDGIPIEQAEAFFNSLYRQGKRARFVRYWGEGHVLRSPANIHDMWQRIFGWLEEFPARAQ